MATPDPDQTTVDAGDRYDYTAAARATVPFPKKRAAAEKHDPAALAAAFWASLVSTPGPLPDPCLVWVKSKNANGYGVLKFQGRWWRAHRLAWSMSRGRVIPPDAVVMHECDTPACCNPTHLALGTQADNNADCRARGRAKPPPRTQPLTPPAPPPV
mgnify:CR=1 FL=1